METMTNCFLKFQIVPMNLVTVAVAPALTLFAVRLRDAAALGLCLLIQAPEGSAELIYSDVQMLTEHLPCPRTHLR